MNRLHALASPNAQAILAADSLLKEAGDPNGSAAPCSDESSPAPATRALEEQSTAGAILEDSPTGVAAFRIIEERARKVGAASVGQWDTDQVHAALDDFKQWHEQVAHRFQKHKVDGSKLKSMDNMQAVAQVLHVPQVQGAVIAEYIKPLVTAAQTADHNARAVQAPPVEAAVQAPVAAVLVVVPVKKYEPCTEDFVIETCLGKGAFGDVRKALHTPSGQHFALKILDKAHIQETGSAAFVVREKELLVLMHEPSMLVPGSDGTNICPFVVQLHFAFQDERKIYMAMTLATGGSLYQNLQAMPHKHFDVETARFYIAELMLAVEWIHSKHVVHRDVKAENAMIAADGHVMLTDLGLAKAWDEDHADLCTASMIGTPCYMAPEVIRESGHGAGFDFWALGILLFEMMVGHTPFQPAGENDGAHTVFVNILMHPPNFPAEPSLPMEACALIVALLAKNPEHRLGSESTGGWAAVKGHPFFSGTPDAGELSVVLPMWDWEVAAARNVIPPHMPLVTSEQEGDTQDSNCRDVPGFDVFVSPVQEEGARERARLEAATFAIVAKHHNL
jgi:serine/threonine protein kinase